MLRKSFDQKCDFRELLLEYNNTPIISLNASPAQILQSRMLKTQLPILESNLEPQIQKHIYTYLCDQKNKLKTYYNKNSRTSVRNYQKGDKVVVKSSLDSIWHKATILEKANEPRSYWIRKESNNKVVRRNSSQMKPSITKYQCSDLVLEPELFPEHNLSSDTSLLNQCNNNRDNDDIVDLEYLFNHTPENNCNNMYPNTEAVNCKISRYGRKVKPTQRLDL